VRLICSYCRRELGEKDPLDDARITHGMCEPCLASFERQYDTVLLGEYLDRFQLPVLAVDHQGRVVATNQRMAQAIGRPDRAVSGLLGGEVMECMYASLPEGCGHTKHCGACTVRRAVMETMATGQPLHQIPAYVDRAGERVDLLISTRLEGELVHLTIHEMQVAGH